MAAGVAAGVLNSRTDYGKGGRRPNLISVNRHRLLELARRQPAKPASPLDSLAAEHRKLLEHFSWEKGKLRGPQTGWRVVTLCATIGGGERGTIRQLAAKLGWSDVTTDEIVRLCWKKLRVLKRIPASGADAALGPFWLTRFEAFKRFAGPEPSECNRTPTLGTRRRPLKAKKKRVTREHSRLLDAVHWSKTPMPTFYQWLNAKAVIESIGDERQVSSNGLAEELGTRRESLEKIARPLVKACWIERPDDDASVDGRKAWKVCWDKIRAAAGELAKPESNGHAKAASKGAPPKDSAPRPATSVGGRKAEWDGVCTWVIRYRTANSGATLSTARIAFREANPNDKIPSLGQLKAALSYRRRKPK
jgi:hypothetical protein